MGHLSGYFHKAGQLLPRQTTFLEFPFRYKGNQRGWNSCSGKRVCFDRVLTSSFPHRPILAQIAWQGGRLCSSVLGCKNAHHDALRVPNVAVCTHISNIRSSVSLCLLCAKHYPECLALITSNPRYEPCTESGFISISKL